MPHAPCTGKASTTSSILSFLISMDVPWYIKPPMKPMMMVSQGFTKAQPAVMDTKPARMPLQKPPTSRSLGGTTNARNMKTTSPATHGDRVVFTATRPAVCASPLLFIDSVLPGLKPYHPNHKQKVPKTTKGMLCGTNSSSFTQRSFRGPTKRAPQIAPTPPTKWTRPLPAKSMYAGPPTMDVLSPESGSGWPKMPTPLQPQYTMTG